MNIPEEEASNIPMPATAIVTRTSALPSIERAKAMLDQAKITGEVRKIKAVAQAVATLERGKEIAIDAAEIILLADARIGELTRAMEHGLDGRPSKTCSPEKQVSKSTTLYAEGISRKQAAECEKVAALADSGALAKYIASCREGKRAPTLKGAIALSKANAKKAPPLTLVPDSDDDDDDDDDGRDGPDDVYPMLRAIEKQLIAQSVTYVAGDGTIGAFIENLEYVVALLKAGATT